MRAYAEASDVLSWLLDERSSVEVHRLLAAQRVIVPRDPTPIECDRVLLRAGVVGELTEGDAAERRAHTCRGEVALADPERRVDPASVRAIVGGQIDIAVTVALGATRCAGGGGDAGACGRDYRRVQVFLGPCGYAMSPDRAHRLLAGAWAESAEKAVPESFSRPDRSRAAYGGKFIRATTALNCGSFRIGSNPQSTLIPSRSKA